MIALIPAYEPDHRLVGLVDDLRLAGQDVVVVDDGSGPAYATVFQAVRDRGATVLTHPVNRGKGAALKTGFRHARGADVVCADADGQHRVEDILRVAAHVRRTGRTTLGVRRFTGPVPVRSSAGNALTRIVFTAITGSRIRDTQTGLRGYPARLLGWLLDVPGERFEYEMRALLLATRHGHPVDQVPIATVYLEHNASSHFRPLVDSARVYAPLLRFAASSMLAGAVDAAVLFALHAATGALLPSVLGARAVSSTVNFVVNRRVVFSGGQASLVSAARRYWTLVATLAVLNYLVLAALTGAGLPLLAAKVATEALLFAVSFLTQHRFVFGSRGAGSSQVAHRAARLDERVTNSG
jgi:putative flippase GtrA